jgi:NADH dehydrogenase
VDVVIGAFGFIGRYIASRLLSSGKDIRTLTNHPGREHLFGDLVSIAPLNFNDTPGLVESLRGAEVLYNTYWIRFPRGGITFEQAVANTRVLVDAAASAGMRRIVHISITNASGDSRLPYFRGKGLAEGIVAESGLSHAIIRPTVVFGEGDILVNNIAWLLRRFPLFGAFGTGEYRVQPVFVGDVAEMAVSAGDEYPDVTMDAVGPDTYTYRELVNLIAYKIGCQARIIRLRPGLALLLSRLIGYLVNDTPVTRDEVQGLMSNLLVSREAPTGHTRLEDWLEENRDVVGKRYVSELARHYR